MKPKNGSYIPKIISYITFHTSHFVAFQDVLSCRSPAPFPSFVSHHLKKNRPTENNPPWKKTHQNGPPTRKWSPCHGRDASGWWSVGIDAVELWLFHLWQPCVKSCFSSFIPPLVCGFNPFEKYESKWESRGENKKSLKPPPTPLLKPTPCSKKTWCSINTLQPGGVFYTYLTG